MDLIIRVYCSSFGAGFEQRFYFPALITGVETDENGIRNSILSTSSHQIFQEKMNCVTSQYSETFQTQFTHNGTSFVMHVKLAAHLMISTLKTVDSMCYSFRSTVRWLWMRMWLIWVLSKLLWKRMRNGCVKSHELLIYPELNTTRSKWCWFTLHRLELYNQIRPNEHY